MVRQAHQQTSKTLMRNLLVLKTGQVSFQVLFNPYSLV
jgi:hypothetical protein